MPALSEPLEARSRQVDLSESLLPNGGNNLFFTSLVNYVSTPLCSMKQTGRLPLL